jgi:hypothetical protein
MNRRQTREKQRQAATHAKRVKATRSARQAEIERRIDEMAHELLAKLQGQSPAVARNNHVVPKLYLSAWANKSGAVQYVDLKQRKPYPKHIKKVAVERDFYTVVMPDGQDSDVWERLISYMEGESKEPLDNAREGRWPLSADDRFVLSHFIALQYVRGPEVREMMNQGMTDVMNMATKVTAQHPDAVRADLEDELQRPATDEEVATRVEHLASGEFTVEMHNNHFLQLFGVCEQIAPLIFSMRWTLLTAAPNAQTFATSDRPISLAPYPDADDFGGIGITTAAYITFPLSPTRCLRLDPPQRGDARRKTFADSERIAYAEEVRAINEMTIAYARECVITKLPAA